MLNSQSLANRPTEHGIAMTIALFVLLLLTALGYGLAVSSRSAIRVGTSVKAQRVAFEAAEAGIQLARERGRLRRGSGTTFTQLLGEVRGGGALVDSRSLANYLGTNGVVNRTPNLPFVPATVLSPATFQVFLANDRADGVASLVDTNERVTFTAFASAPRAVGFAGTQVEVRVPLPDLPILPGLLTLPGPTVDFDPFESNAHNASGDDRASTRCYLTVAVTSAAAVAAVSAEILGPPNRSGQYRSCNPAIGPPLSGLATVSNFLANQPLAPASPYEPSLLNVPPFGAGDRRLISVPYLTELVERIRDVAHFTSTSDPGFTLGTLASPKAVVIDGDFALERDGAGILVVTGELTYDGNIDYTGLILVIGEGRLHIDGAGNGSFAGAALVANTADPWDLQGLYVGVPHFRANGQGTSFEVYDSVAARGEPVRFDLPLEIMSFQHLR